MTTSKKNKAATSTSADGWSQPHCGLSHKIVGHTQLVIMTLPGAVVAMALIAPARRKPRRVAKKTNMEVLEMIDQIYHYKGYYDCPSQCRLQVNGNVVIVTDLDGDTGTSITNMAEHLATQVINEFGIKPENLVWIEHYPERGHPLDRFPENFDLVTFTWDGQRFRKPVWKPMISEVAKRRLQEGR